MTNIGDGRVTVEHVSSIESWTAMMTARGHDEKILSFIVRTCAPKGHPLHLSACTAAKKLFPKQTRGAVINRAYGVLTRGGGFCGHLCDLFFGRQAKDLKTEHDNRKALLSKGGRRRLQAVKKAEAIARRRLCVRWRKLMDCPGRIPKRLEASCQEYVTAHLEDAVKSLSPQPHSGADGARKRE